MDPVRAQYEAYPYPARDPALPVGLQVSGKQEGLLAVPRKHRKRPIVAPFQQRRFW